MACIQFPRSFYRLYRYQRPGERGIFFDNSVCCGAHLWTDPRTDRVGYDRVCLGRRLHHGTYIMLCLHHYLQANTRTGSTSGWVYPRTLRRDGSWPCSISPCHVLRRLNVFGKCRFHACHSAIDDKKVFFVRISVSIKEEYKCMFFSVNYVCLRIKLYHEPVMIPTRTRMMNMDPHRDLGGYILSCIDSSNLYVIHLEGGKIDPLQTGKELRRLSCRS